MIPPEVVAGVGVLLALLCAGRARRSPEVEPSSAPEPPPGHVRAWWAEQLRDSGVEGPPLRWAAVAATGVVALAGGAALRAGAGGALAAVAVVGAAAAVGRAATRGRGDRRADRLLPDLIDHIARHLRAGRDLPTALRGAAHSVEGAHGEELARATERMAGGADLAGALAPWELHHPRPEVRLAVGALTVAARTGGAAAPALDGVAATLRSRQSVAEEVRALSSQARASASVLIALPLVVAVMGCLADERVARSLLATPLGLVCLAAATGLDVAGAWWMHRIVAVSR